MQTQVTQAFDALVQQIKNAVAERAFYSVCERAMALGLTAEKIDSKFSIRYHFEYIDATGARLILYAYSYDPSGPMEQRPGITRFTLTLAENNGAECQFEDEYAGLVSSKRQNA